MFESAEREVACVWLALQFTKWMDVLEPATICENSAWLDRRRESPHVAEAHSGGSGRVGRRLAQLLRVVGGVGAGEAGAGEARLEPLLGLLVRLDHIAILLRLRPRREEQAAGSTLVTSSGTRPQIGPTCTLYRSGLKVRVCVCS